MPQWRGPARRPLPANWPRLCREVREIHGSACYVCGHGDAVDTDHVVPRSQGGADSLANLRPICGKNCQQCAAEHKPTCHLSKSGREGAQAQSSRRKRTPERHPGLR